MKCFSNIFYKLFIYIYVFIYYLYIFFHIMHYLYAMAYKIECIKKILLLRHYYIPINVIYISRTIRLIVFIFRE